MFIFDDEKDLMRLVELFAERADKQAEDETNLKRERMIARARAAALREVLEYMKDYFTAREVTN